MMDFVDINVGNIKCSQIKLRTLFILMENFNHSMINYTIKTL